MKKTWVIFGTIGTAGLVAVLLWMQIPGETVARAEKPEQATPVVVASVTETAFADQIEALGTTAANEAVVVTVEVTGRIERIHFQDGAQVDQGAVLVTMDRDEETASLAAAQANLNTQKIQYARLLDLVARKNAAQTTLDEQTNALKRAEADVEIAQARLRNMTIKAPFAGQLGIRRVSPGALVNPGTEIVTLDALSPIKLDFSIPETFLASLKRGLDIEAGSAAFPQRPFEGKVTTIGTRVDPVTRSVVVRAELPNPDGLLKPGMLMTVTLISNRTQALVVPEGSLVALGERHYVYRVNTNSKVDRVEVGIGRRRPGSAEVLRGLEVGDLVVVEGTTRVGPGSPVKVVHKPDAERDNGRHKG